MRVKDYLSTRGVEFVAINLQSDPEALEALAASGMKALPVVAAGGRYALGIDLPAVDDILGLPPRAREELTSAGDLVESTRRLLEASARFARQVPAAHYDDEIPGMEGVDGPLLLPDGTPVVLADGTPYMPHRTCIGLIRHIVGHGAKAYLVITDSQSRSFRRMEVYAPLGEPDDSVTVSQLAAQLEATAQAIERWWEQSTPHDLDQLVETFWGTHTVHKVLNDNRYSLAQHTRQLMTILIDFGIEPNRGLTEGDHRGVELPARVWD